ncbi:heart- and neural crest derivatives-expressed protein 2-like [Diabrotica undecimpunctata]|uniref:heart- and neural crest derivatives-expressed protein 2-like n=1 Tax=Diabrotica undecimpunctata TaxID=50387 RepID=UPI003B63D5C9
MAYNNSPPDHHQDMYHYGYPPHTYQYLSDGGSTVGGEDTNFWSHSPSRPDTTSPKIINSTLGGTYPLYATVGHSNIYRLGPINQPYPNPHNPDTEIHTTGSFVRVVKRRTTANKKERRRTQSINMAYADLRDCIPNVPADTKLSKIKTLRLATSYISYLTHALETDDPAGGFKAEIGTISRKSNNQINLSNSAQVNGCTVEHITTESVNSEDLSNSRKAKGRTGWPQHVWALEFKKEPTL